MVLYGRHHDLNFWQAISGGLQTVVCNLACLTYYMEVAPRGARSLAGHKLLSVKLFAIVQNNFLSCLVKLKEYFEIIRAYSAETIYSIAVNSISDLPSLSSNRIHKKLH